MKKLPLKFYERENVVQIARELIGKILLTDFDGEITSGRIVETEAYAGVTDKASHAYQGRRTARNQHMYSAGGTAYVYLCYGIHQMLNVVTNKINIPDAILIRAAEPVDGINIMLRRTGKTIVDRTLTRGPGNVSKSLGVSKTHSGLLFNNNSMYIAEDGKSAEIAEQQIGESKRIGIDYAEEDALLPYRFYLKGNSFVSATPFK
jgi:DNA-3-methyladenine glycosylase